MPSSESRTYVTTTTVPWAVAYLNDAATIGYDAKIESLKWLLEKKPASKSRLNQQLQQNHSLNKRQANSIIAYVEGQVKSSKESRGNHLKQLIGQLKHTTEVIEKLEKKIKAHRKYLQAFEEVNRGKRKKVPKFLKPKYPEACPMRCTAHLTLYRQARVKLHQKKRYAHKLRQKIAHLKASHQHVNLGNKYTVEMIGSKDESYGNQICQLDLIGKELHIRVPYALENRYGSCIQFPIRLPQHGTDLLATAWYNRQALTYRFIQKSLTEWEIHITFDVEPASRITAPVSWGAIGVDLNPNCIGWAMTDKDGNLDGFGQVKVNIQSQPKGRTEAIVVDVVTDLTTIALEYKRPIVVEKLDFTEKKKRLRELNAKTRRMLSNFAYSKFLQLLLARCFKLGIQVIQVNPAYSSWIALIKFMSMYGMNSATAAAFVLARRGMFLSERLPANTAYQGTEPRKHVWSDWRSVAKRTKGSSRHSFFQPRLTVYSRLRSVRGFHSLKGDEAISAVDNPNGELGEVGENPTGSRYTA